MDFLIQPQRNWHCRIFWGGKEAAAYILALQEWEKLFDSEFVKTIWEVSCHSKMN